MIQRLITAGESEHGPNNESENVYIHPPFLSTHVYMQDCAHSVRNYTDFWQSSTYFPHNSNVLLQTLLLSYLDYYIIEGAKDYNIPQT